MTPIATLVTGILLGSGGTWLFTRLRRGDNTTPTTITVEPTKQPESAAATTRRWQMPSFRRQQATVADAPAAVVEEDPVTSTATPEVVTAA